MIVLTMAGAGKRTLAEYRTDVVNLVDDFQYTLDDFYQDIPLEPVMTFISVIREHTAQGKIVLANFTPVLARALNAHREPWYYVNPHVTQKEQYIKRLKARGTEPDLRASDIYKHYWEMLLQENPKVDDHQGTMQILQLVNDYTDLDIVLPKAPL